jgi:hypothetical protein
MKVSRFYRPAAQRFDQQRNDTDTEGPVGWVPSHHDMDTDAGVPCWVGP